MFQRIKNSLIARGYWEEAGADGGAGGGGDGGQAGEGGGAGAGQEDKTGQGGEGDKGDDDDVAGLLGRAAAALKAKKDGGDSGDKGGDKGGEGDKPTTYTIEATDLEAIPEQFRKDGKLNAEALVKSWKDSRQELKNHQGKAPEKADDYKLELPKVSDKEIEVKNDEFMTAVKSAAHKHGLSQEQFQGVMGDALKTLASQLPADIDPVEELNNMGEKGQVMVDGVLNWAEKLKNDGILGDDDMREFLVTGATASGVRMLNKLRELSGEKAIPANLENIGEGLPSKEELYAMVASDKYQHDPSYREKVDKQFEQVFGTDPNQSSPAGLGVRPRAKAG